MQLLLNRKSCLFG